MNLEQQMSELVKDCRAEFKEMATFRGLVSEYMKNTSEHLNAVSNKANDIRDDINDHKENKNAHGAEILRESKKDYLGLISLIISVGGFILVLWKTARAGG